MSRICYVNGRYVAHRDAVVHVEDRGYVLSDGVYEVTAIRNGRPVDFDGHMDRMAYSLSELRITPPMSRAAMTRVAREVVRRNKVTKGVLYTQITRGVAPRVHQFPEPTPRPALVMWAKSQPGAPDSVAEAGVKLKSVLDNRWARRDIKSISLLGNVLMKQAAKEAGAFESLQIDADGMVTEAAAANIWIVTGDRVLVTRPLSSEILSGITRKTVMALAKAQGFTIEERVFSLQEVLAAKEVFLTGTTTACMPVVRIDDHTIADGVPGPVALGLRQSYQHYGFQHSGSDVPEVPGGAGPVWYQNPAAKRQEKSAS